MAGYIAPMRSNQPHRGDRCDAMILAAGRGERMRPLTDDCPKPLLAVRGKPLMQWPIEALARAGVRDILVNTDWLGMQIERHFCDPSVRRAIDAQARLAGASTTTPVQLRFSHEGRDFGAALETAGGIARALPQLADPFWLVAGDVFMPTFTFSNRERTALLADDMLAMIWLVPNPPHHPQGDFAVSAQGRARNDGPLCHTYSGIGLLRHALFAPPYCAIAPGNPQGVRAKLAPLLRLAAQQDRLGAALYTGPWTDVGTPARLAALQTTGNPPTHLHSP